MPTQSLHPTLSRRRVLTLGAGLPFAIALGGCDALGDVLKPLVGRLLNLEFRDISSGFVNLGMGLNVFNPNPIGLPEMGLNLGLNLANEDIARFGTESPFDLPSEGGANLDLGVGVNALGTIAALLSLRNASEVPYNISGRATSAKVSDLSLPLSASGAVDLR